MTSAEQIYRDLLMMVMRWQEAGRNPQALPMLDGDLVMRLERLADDYRHASCTVCKGISSGACEHCKPLAGELREILYWDPKADDMKAVLAQSKLPAILYVPDAQRKIFALHLLRDLKFTQSMIEIRYGARRIELGDAMQEAFQALDDATQKHCTGVVRLSAINLALYTRMIASYQNFTCVYSREISNGSRVLCELLFCYSPDEALMFAASYE